MAAEKGPVEVVIRNVTDLEEVIVSVLETTTLRELKEILMVQVERPELMDVGEILRMLPDGTTAPIKETMKVGIRRLLGFTGCPLHPPPPPRPPPTLEDFYEFDPDEDIVTSPRSVQACSLEGVGREDLIYVPLEDYQERGIEPRIAELWYAFFEALRQDRLATCRGVRRMLIAEEEGQAEALVMGGEKAITGFGGHWCGALEHSKCPNVAQFFRERNEMCDIERIYKGATKPCRPPLKGSRFSSSCATFHDEDPVYAGDNADNAADKLYDLLSYYESIPRSKKFVEEQRLKTHSNGIVQFGDDCKRLHKGQKELRNSMDHRIETSEAQVLLGDGNIMERMEIRSDQDLRANDSTIANLGKMDPARTKLARLKMPGLAERANFLKFKKNQRHYDQVEAEYTRCDKMQEIILHDQAVEERVHQHLNLKKIAFAREWVKRRVRWQLNNNSVSASRNAFNDAITQKQKAATERVDTQRLIRQKCVEYKREIRLLTRMYADLSAKREKGRQDARREAVSMEFSRMSVEEAMPSPSPLRRSKASFSGSMSGSVGGSMMENGGSMAPFSHLLKQPRVVKRIARFDFGRIGSGSMFSSPSLSTQSGGFSPGMSSTMHQSMSMPSLNGSSQ